MDSFDFEMAGRFCQRALELEPNNKQTLDMLGHIHSELGDAQRAKGISFTEEHCVRELGDTQQVNVKCISEKRCVCPWTCICFLSLTVCKCSCVPWN